MIFSFILHNINYSAFIALKINPSDILVGHD